MNPPDIIFIVLDTQRADRLGCYGYQRPITPNLDRFAAQSVLFEQAISPAQWTIPSHASLFTGLYPTAHQVTQSSHALSPNVPHLAEVLRDTGYQTIGFCNNPLVGILNNGFKRGFQTFYNYGGAIPSLPQDSTPLPWPLNRLAESYTQFLRRISYPIQNFFGRSDLAFRLSLNAWLTPLWSKFANFKGQNERSVQDVSRFLQRREQQSKAHPLFLFLNLMETHLPFWPPGEFVDRVAPYFRTSKEARTILRTWNREAYRWAAPLAEPLGELENRVLSDMYDAEVAYQDDYLGKLFDVLNGRANRDNTLTIIVSDHGDGLGEHGFFGHAFVAYQELVHVPLLLHWPRRLPAARYGSSPPRISTPVSTRRIFHTILEAAGRLPENSALNAGQIQNLTLWHTVNGRDAERHTAFSEIYPPLNFARAIAQRQPHLLEQFRCLLPRRAIVKGEANNTTLKLIEVDEQPDELFNLVADPLELDDILPAGPSDHFWSSSVILHQELDRMAAILERQRDSDGTGTLLSPTAGQVIDPEADEHLLKRLRGLGYIE